MCLLSFDTLLKVDFLLLSWEGQSEGINILCLWDDRAFYELACSSNEETIEPRSWFLLFFIYILLGLLPEFFARPINSSGPIATARES